MRIDRVNSILTIIKSNTPEEQHQKIDTAVKNKYITETEAGEIRKRLEEMNINWDKVRAIYRIIEKYSPEKKETSLENAIKNGYINEYEKRRVVELLMEQENKKYPYKEKIEKTKENKEDIWRLALEYILGENSNYVLRMDIKEEQKKAIKEALLRIKAHVFTKNEIEILKKLIPQFVTEEQSQNDIYIILGFKSDMIATIEKPDDGGR